MAAQVKIPKLKKFTAVRIERYKLVVFGGNTKVNRLWEESQCMRVIYTYDYVSDKWRQDQVVSSSAPPPTACARGVWLDGRIAVFGGIKCASCEAGIPTNDTWLLDRSNHDYRWNLLKASPKPSPRYHYLAWGWNNKMYIFGGLGHHPNRYLGGHCKVRRISSASVHADRALYTNNQLLVLTPQTGTWSVISTGSKKPKPGMFLTSDTVCNQVFILGGLRTEQFYMLNLNSHTWVSLNHWKVIKG